MPNKLDAWVNSLSKGELNSVLAYLTLKETEELKKAMEDSKGKVVTPAELEENSIVPDLSRDKDGKNIGKKIDIKMYREVPQMDTDMNRWTEAQKLITDISKMKRVIELNTNKDERQLDLRRIPMTIQEEELDTLRTLANTVRIIEEAKITGRVLTPLPFPLLEYILAYEAEFGDLQARYEGETDKNGG